VTRATLSYLLSLCCFLEKLEDENRGQNTQENETKYFTDLRNGARGGRLKHDENVCLERMAWNGCVCRLPFMRGTALLRPSFLFGESVCWCETNVSQEDRMGDGGAVVGEGRKEALCAQCGRQA